MIFKTKIGTNNEAKRSSWIEQVLLKIPTGVRILDAGAGELKYKKYCSYPEYASQDFYSRNTSYSLLCESLCFNKSIFLKIYAINLNNINLKNRIREKL